MARYDADWIESLLQPTRRGSPPAVETLTHLGLSPGQVVADVGCGPGFFTLPLAELVRPNGLVYAIDVEASMLELIQSRAAAAGISGIETDRASGNRIPLDDSTADLTLCGLVLHEMNDRRSFVQELIRVTRPTGRIAVVEFTPTDDEPRSNRLSPAETSALFAEAGRAVREIVPVGSQQYLAIIG